MAKSDRDEFLVWEGTAGKQQRPVKPVSRIFHTHSGLGSSHRPSFRRLLVFKSPIENVGWMRKKRKITNFPSLQSSAGSELILKYKGKKAGKGPFLFLRVFLPCVAN